MDAFGADSALLCQIVFFSGFASEQLEILERVEPDVGSVRQPNGNEKQKKTDYSLESQIHFYPHVTLMKEHVCV